MPQIAICHLQQSLDLIPIDSTVGIRVKVLAQMGTGSTTTALLGARIDPGMSMTPHWHAQGGELYSILRGVGEMRLALLTESNSPQDCQFYSVQSGDCFAIEEKVVHSLRNTGTDILEVVIVGHPSHLGSDRNVYQEVFP